MPWPSKKNACNVSNNVLHFLTSKPCMSFSSSENNHIVIVQREVSFKLSWGRCWLLMHTPRKRRDFQKSLVGFPLHVLWIRFPLWQNRILGPTKLSRKWKRPDQWKFFVQIEADIDYLRILFVFTYWQHLFKTLSLLFEPKRESHDLFNSFFQNKRRHYNTANH